MAGGFLSLRLCLVSKEREIEREALPFGDGRFDEGFAAFAGLAGEGVGNDDAIVAAVAPAGARVVGIGDDQNSSAGAVGSRSRIVNPTEFPTPGGFLIRIAAIIQDGSTLGDGKSGMHTHTKTALLLVAEMKIAFRIEEFGLDAQKQ